MNTAAERRIVVNARKESVSELCDVLNQLRNEIKPSEADLTARIIEHCVQRVVGRLSALINVMAEPQTMEDCERLRGLTNDFISAYNGGVERVADAGLEFLRPIPHHQMLHAPIKPSPQ